MTERLQFHSFDMLRGIAAVSVALYHAGWVHAATRLDMLPHTVLMVDLFFVLSGFVISYNYEQRLRTTSGAAEFIKRRFWRVWPLHMVMLAVFIGIEVLRFAYEATQGVTLAPPAFSRQYFESVLANTFLVQALGPFADHARINAVSWSISVEFYTYLLFAVLCLTGRLRGVLLLAAAVGSAWILLNVHGQLTGRAPIFGLYRSVWSFAIGYFAYQGFVLLRHRAGQVDRRLWFLAGCGVLGATVFWGFETFGDTRAELAIPLVYGIAILCLAFGERPGDFGQPVFRPMLWLGQVSYSIYMVHLAINWFFVQTLRVVLDWDRVPVDGMQDKFYGGFLMGNLVLVLYLAAVCWISHLSFRHIENRFRIRGTKPLAKGRYVNRGHA